jgi:IS5 family transposase
MVGSWRRFAMEFNETGLFKFASHVYDLSKRVVKPYRSRFSKKTYTQQQHLSILLLKAKTNSKLREIEELLIVSPVLQQALDLTRVPDHTTLCRAMQRLRPLVFQLLLILSGGLLPASGKLAVDSTGFDLRHASKHYVKRAKMRLSSMKTSYAVDTQSQMILGVHTTVTRRHDSQIILPLVEKVMQDFPVKVCCADRGYDSKHVRDELKEVGVRPLIKHREFKPQDKAHNKRMKKQDYNQRVKTETVNSCVKRKTGDTLTTKTYWQQVRETHIKAITHNIERHINKQTILAYARIATELKIFDIDGNVNLFTFSWQIIY